MSIRVQEIINFQNGKAEVFLPKGATNITVAFEGRLFYFFATADSNQTEKEKYQLLSYEEKQKLAEGNEIKFLRKVNIIGAGVFYWYYKKIS